MFEQAKIIFTRQIKDELKNRLNRAFKAGDAGMSKRISALLALGNGNSPQVIAEVLRCSVQGVYNWIRDFILQGVDSLKRKKSPGRPPKLTKSRKRRLGELIDAGPEECGFSGACWRSPMIQELILGEFGILYSVKYLAELLKNMGFSFQKAKFVSDHLDEEKRRQWMDSIWPEILDLAKRRNMLIMFGDEVSFPMWGSLSYTWGRRGAQPTIKTSGKRKGHKVFGLVSYTDGRFFSKGIEERFNSDSYIEFLKEVSRKTERGIILIQDGAKYHTSKQTKAFFEDNKAKFSVFQLPSYSPDYNPIEKLWKRIKQTHIHLHYFPTFGDLMNKVQEAMLVYENSKDEILALFGFYRKLEA